VLVFELLPGRRDAFAARFRELAVLVHASRQPGFLRGELCLAADGSDRAMVTAEWDSPEAYQGWLDNPIRPVLAAELDPFLAAPPEPQIYETLEDVRTSRGGS
jgi:heme-degrading monooxygenase HmoA